MNHIPNIIKEETILTNQKVNELLFEYKNRSTK